MVWLRQRSSCVAEAINGAGSSSRQPVKGSHVPATTMLLFDALPNPSGVASKIKSLSLKLAEAPDYGSLLLTDQEAASGSVLDRLLSRCACQCIKTVGCSIIRRQ